MPRKVPAVNKALDVLELFSAGNGALSASQIGSVLKLPRSTLHELLATLVNRSYLTLDRPSGFHYQLGRRLFELGGAYASSIDLFREANEVSRQVSQESGETVHVAILDGSDVIYIAKADSSRVVRMVSAVGRRLPAHASAVGKVLLAALPNNKVVAAFKGKQLERFTPNTIVSLPALIQVLEKVRVQGLAYDTGEETPDVQCIAAPIRDASGAVAAAMSISVPSFRLSASRRHELEAVLKAGAAELSGRLGAFGINGREAAEASS